MRARQSAARYGKARHTHNRSRSARQQSRNAIHEYLDPESDAGYIQVERSIPIRRRNDFLQCVAVGDGPKPDEIAGSKSSQQMELTFHGTQGDTVRSSLVAGATEPVHERKSPDSAVPSVTNAGYTVRGFVYGCALGGAAAAAMLIVVQLVSL